MACNCLHIANTFVVNDDVTQVVLQFITSVAVSDTNNFCFKIVTTLPSNNATYNLYATVNGENVPILNKYGNQMAVSDVRKCKLYKGYFGTKTTPHIIALNTPITCNLGCKNVL